MLGQAGAPPGLAGHWSPGDSSLSTTCACPGMLHGRVVRPPAVGATVVSVDESSVKDMPGLVKVVVQEELRRRGGGKALAGDAGRRQAESRRGRPARGCRSTRTSTNRAATRSRRATRCWWIRKTWSKRSRSARTVVKATYHHPYQMHGSVGSSCAVADVQGDKATIYSPTQGVWHQQSTVGDGPGAEARKRARDLPPRVGLLWIEWRRRGDVTTRRFFRRPWASRCACSSRARTRWPGRKYGIRVRAGRARRPRRAGQHRRVGSRSLVAGAAGTGPASSIARQRRERACWLDLNRMRLRRVRLRRSRAAYNNNSNGMPSYFAGRVGGTDQGTGTIKSERSLVHNVLSRRSGPGRCARPRGCKTRSRTRASWTSSPRSVKADPVEFRLRHLQRSRA